MKTKSLKERIFEFAYQVESAYDCVLSFKGSPEQVDKWNMRFCILIYMIDSFGLLEEYEAFKRRIEE